MNIFVFITLFFISHSIFANESVSLEWKINKGEVIAYKTKMSPPKDGNDNFIKFDVDKILKEKSFN